MEDKYIKYVNWDSIFDVDLESLYGPMTYKKMVQKYNFNNPGIEDYWEKEVKRANEEILNETRQEKENKRTFGDFEIELCYL